jgi:two-component system sensor histidine kinase RpfC
LPARLAVVTAAQIAEPQALQRALATALRISPAHVGERTAGETPFLAKRSLHILVAEDNAINRKVIGKILERAGHTIHFVSNGAEALDVLESEKFDIALLDVNMPQTSGLDVAKLYRFAHSDGPRLPIVALTADATPEARRACEQAGMDAYLTKPVDLRELLELLDSLALPRAADEVPFAGTADKPYAPAAAKDRAPVVDLVALDNLRALDPNPEFLNDVLRTFIIDTQEIIQDLHVALHERDITKFRNHAHALRSSAANVGAARLRACAADIDASSAAQFERDGEAKLAEIVSNFASFQEKIAPYLEPAKLASTA